VKILFAMDEYFAANNGGGISAQRFADELKKRGHEVRILASDVNGQPEFPLGEFKLPLFDPLVKKQGVTFAKADQAVIREAVEWADLVHLENCFVVASKTAKTAAEMGKPCTGVFHTYPENITSSIHLAWMKPVNKALARAFERNVFQYCSDIHCPSEKVMQNLINWGYTADLHVISNGVTPEFEYHRIPKPEAFQDKFVILMTGRYSREKRQDVLIKAVKKSKYEDRIQLIFAGQGPLEKQYQRLSKNLSNKPVFGFLQKTELKQVMAYSDLYIHTAQVEIEGMSCLEAIASGLVPIIADGKMTSTGKFALDSRSLFKSGDAKELSQKIDYWLENAEERRHMERVYHEHAEEYAIHKSAQELEKMFLGAYKKIYGANSALTA